jgi:tRNA(Ile2) C34 agmatinyltransferase TiaS
MTTMLPAAEPEPVEKAPACLGCGSQRMDWTGSGWKCQECGAVEPVESRKVA